jgi:uncharacterized phage infection (PIP) family protein YhgE
MGEIMAASIEQTAGIEQINEAIAQMDHVTQQNAALVEEAAAAASSLQDQAGGLSDVVSVFRVAGGHTMPQQAAHPAARTAATAANAARRSASPKRAAPATRLAVSHGDTWE